MTGFIKQSSKQKICRSIGLGLFGRHQAVYVCLYLIVIIFLLLEPCRAQDGTNFREVEIEAPFHNLLLNHPEFMEEGGARVFIGEDGTKYLIGISKVISEDNNEESIQQAIRIGEILSRTAILEFKEGIEISNYRKLKECADNKISLSSFFQVTEARVEGIVKNLPIIGSWWSPNRNTLYVAVGKAMNAAFHQVNIAENVSLEKDNDALILSLLRMSPVLCKNGGVKGFIIGKNRRVLISVGSAKLNDSFTKAQRIAQLKAYRSLLGRQQGIHITSVEYLSDYEELRLTNNVEQRVLLSQFLSIQEEKIAGLVKALPIVATWKSPEGKILYVAIGKVLIR